jgi:hypothetical protein
MLIKGGSYGHRVAFMPSRPLADYLYPDTLKIYDATPLPEKP